MFAEKKGPDIQSDLILALFQRGQHRTRILKMFRNHLHMFSVEYVIIPEEISPKEIEMENYISGQLALHFNEKAPETGYLLNCQADGPDIVIYQKGGGLHKPVFFIEAKRLPPTSSKEYVKGKTGGIERFKKEKHCKDDNVAGMLGYVQEHNFDYWYEQVNSWITELISDPAQSPRWEDQDKLIKTYVGDIGEYQSIHSRLQKNPIILHHFWINLYKN